MNAIDSSKAIATSASFFCISELLVSQLAFFTQLVQAFDKSEMSIGSPFDFCAYGLGKSLISFENILRLSQKILRAGKQVLSQIFAESFDRRDITWWFGRRHIGSDILNQCIQLPFYIDLRFGSDGIGHNLWHSRRH